MTQAAVHEAPEAPERRRIVEWANEIGKLSRRRGAPRLAIDSPRELILEWLLWNDPNGIYTDRNNQLQGWDPVTFDEAWDLLEEQYTESNETDDDTRSYGPRGREGPRGGRPSGAGEARRRKPPVDEKRAARQNVYEALWKDPEYVRLQERKDSALHEWNQFDAYKNHPRLAEPEKLARALERSDAALKAVYEYEDAAMARADIPVGAREGGRPSPSGKTTFAAWPQVRFRFDDETEWQTSSLTSFLQNNHLYEEDERALRAGDRVTLGGGAAPLVHVELVQDNPQGREPLAEEGPWNWSKHRDSYVGHYKGEKLFLIDPTVYGWIIWNVNPKTGVQTTKVGPPMATLNEAIAAAQRSNPKHHTQRVREEGPQGGEPLGAGEAHASKKLDDLAVGDRITIDDEPWRVVKFDKSLGYGSGRSIVLVDREGMVGTLSERGDTPVSHLSFVDFVSITPPAKRRAREESPQGGRPLHEVGEGTPAAREDTPDAGREKFVAEETFDRARGRLLEGLRALGWTTKPFLKVPQALSPEGVQLFFRTQAIYQGEHSLESDMRTVSVEQLLAAVARRSTSPHFEETKDVADAVPWLKITRDPELYAEGLKRAKEIGPLDGARQVYDLLAPALAKEDQEVFLVVLLDVRQQCLGVAEVARGARSRVSVDRADIAHVVAKAHCESFIVVHNHPTGDPTPSAADKALTESIQETGDGMDVPCVDHVVIGMGKYYSFAEGKVTKVKERGK